MRTPWSTSGEGTTGRFLVLIEDGAAEAASRDLAAATGGPVVDSRAAGDRPPPTGGVVFADLGVAVVAADPRRAGALPRAAGVMAVEPERTVLALEAPPAGPGTAPFDESEMTWGLQAVGVPGTAATGDGVGVAVLDTGVAQDHPDLDPSRVTAASFVDGERAEDGHGHGTHCIGTACGPASPGEGPRYGVAPGTRIFAGKVLSDGGSGSDSGILAGIEWALRNACRVISMSLGARVRPGDAFSEVFETVARRALARGTVIVAAAGNDSRRAQGLAEPVAHPANCPSILAVGAVDEQITVADFSNRGDDPSGGQLDFAAPGVDILSAWTMPRRTRRISGTSMATPHVAGLLALYAEVAPEASADGLVAMAFRSARRLEHPSFDVGAGLIQAP